MQNKTRNWTDVELIISSVSVALTLGFWGLFASRQKTGADVVGQVALVSSSTNNSITSQTGVPTSLVTGQTIFFGAATPPPLVSSQPKPRHRGGGGGGGGGGGAAASTGSSH